MSKRMSFDEELAARIRQRATELTKQYIDEHGIELNEEEFELFVQEALRAMTGEEERGGAA